MTDLAQLAYRIDQAGLMHRSLHEMTPEEVERIISMIHECTGTDCCYAFICQQIPSYITKCKGVDKCQRAIYFARNKIPKQGSSDDRSE